MKVEVECRTLQEATEAATAGAHVVMFDNFTPQVKFCFNILLILNILPVNDYNGLCIVRLPIAKVMHSTPHHHLNGLYTRVDPRESLHEHRRS